MTNSNELRLCTWCNKANARLCNGCKSARYCSNMCQKVDWLTHRFWHIAFPNFDRPTHQLPRIAFPNFDISGRLTDEHRRATLSLVDMGMPTFIWLDRESHVEGYDNQYQIPETETIFGGDDGFPTHYTMPHKPMQTSPTTYHYSDIKVKVVRIDCIGDQKVLGKPRFEAVEIPDSGPIFSNPGPPNLTHVFHSYFTRIEFQDDIDTLERESPLSNQNAPFVCLRCDPESSSDFDNGMLGCSFATKE